MKIAFFGYDFFIDSVEELANYGHVISNIFIGDADNFYNHNLRTLELARRLGSCVHVGKPKRELLQSLRDEGCELALVMAYQYKVPVLNGLRGANLHPTLLPQGRGIWPLPWLLLEHKDCAGLTLHKLTDEMDAGPILSQKKLTLSENENLETLSAKVQIAARSFVREALDQIDALWDSATPQAGGSTWPMPSDSDRLLRWEEGVDQVLKVVRAFGKFESTAILGESEWMVTDAAGWKESHVRRPGEVVHRLGREVVVAVSDGYVLLRHYHRELDFSKP